MSPAYNFLTNAPALSQGDAFLVFNNELVTAAEFSQQVALAVSQAAGTKGIRVVIDHSANPGNCEYQICESDNDGAGSSDYVQVPSGGDLTQAGLTNGPNGASTRLTADLIPVAGQNVSIYVKTAPSNANIKVTARITKAV